MVEDNWHAGVAMLTLEHVHLGRAAEVTARRQGVLAASYAAHFEHLVAGPPRAAALAEDVWITASLPLPVSTGDAPAVPTEGRGSGAGQLPTLNRWVAATPLAGAERSCTGHAADLQHGPWHRAFEEALAGRLVPARERRALPALRAGDGPGARDERGGRRAAGQEPHAGHSGERAVPFLKRVLRSMTRRANA